MGLVSDFERIEQGRILSNYKDSIVNNIQGIRTKLQIMVTAKTTYPEAAAEIDALIAQAKTALIDLANQF